MHYLEALGEVAEERVDVAEEGLDPRSADAYFLHRAWFVYKEIVFIRFHFS